MAMFDPEDVEKLMALPQETILQSLKTCFMELFFQVGEAGESGDAKKYLQWLQESVDDKRNAKSELMQALEVTRNALQSQAETFDPIRQSVKDLVLSSSPVEAVDKDKGRSLDVIRLNQFFHTTFVSDGIHKYSVDSSHRCESCGSFSTVPRLLISHSASVESLIQLFKFQLPDLSDLNLLDIGSGLGSVLYGAYFFSQASQITGIELNDSCCRVVSQVIDKYNLQDRLKIVCGDLMDHAEAIKSHHVIVFNNALEYFAPLEVQKQIWMFLRNNMKPGVIFVTNPDLDTLLRPLGLDCFTNDWVDPLKPRLDESMLRGLPDTDELFCLYKVKESDVARK